MIDKNFNNWIVIEQVENGSNGSTRYLCQCKCGNRSIHTVSNLNHHVKHDGHFCKECIKKELKEKYHLDFIGFRQGSWTVRSFEGKNAVGSKLWLCECDCGSQRIVGSAYLNPKSKRVLTTCKKCELKKLEEQNRFVQDIPSRFWQRFLNHSKRREIEVSFTKQKAFELYLRQNKKCIFTKKPLYFSKLTTNYNRYTNASIDRIDSSKPYSLDNIQWVDKKINMMKGCLSQQEFIDLCRQVTESTLQSLQS